MRPLLPKTSGRRRAAMLVASTLLSALSFLSSARIHAAEIQAGKAPAVKVQIINVPAVDTIAQASSGPLQCQIRRNESSIGVELIGVVSSARAIAGRASFAILKSGTAGTSNIRQGNHFAIDAGKEAIVGRATIGLEPGAVITVDLSLISDDGLECRVAAPLEH